MQTPFKVILASKSPRRLRFFNELGLEVEIRTNAVKEDYPAHLMAREIPDYLAQLKANALKNTIKSGEILVTSDTVVWHKNHSLAKPKDRKEAYDMLRTLSNDWHEVITSVCFTTTRAQRTVGQTTWVKFRELQNREIEYYIDNYRPFDKAGGYGIQEWIGLIGIEEIQGSYSNVVGLPTHLVYTTLRELVGDSLMDNIEKNTAL